VQNATLCIATKGSERQKVIAATKQKSRAVSSHP